MSEPVSLRDALAVVGREFGLPDSDTMASVQAVWIEVVGAALAAHAIVRSVRDGVCTVAVDGPSWATPLRYLEPEVVAAAGRRLGPGIVTSVRVQIGGQIEGG
ncbi:MAG: DciA family protein [Actinomycetota bacterium]